MFVNGVLKAETIEYKKYQMFFFVNNIAAIYRKAIVVIKTKTSRKKLSKTLSPLALTET